MARLHKPVGARVVRNAQRKRKLQKRGESIYWSLKHNAWVWWPRIEISLYPQNNLTDLDRLHMGA